MKKLIAILSLSLCVHMYAQVPSNVPTGGLVGYWPFNGNANDISGNGNNGTVTNATLTGDRFGYANAAYNYAGNANIVANLSTSLDTNWTVSGWYYKTGNTNYNAEYFLSFGNSPNGNGLGFGGSYNLCEPGYFSLYDGAGSGPCFTGDNLLDTNLHVVYGNWQHMVIVKSGSTYSIYTNSVLQASGTMSSVSVNQLVIGMRADNQFNFNGYIDDIGIWNRVLTASEIDTLYSGYSNPTTPTPTVTPGVCNRNVFNDNFSTPSNWTTIGTGSVNVSAGTCNLNNVYDGTYNKIYQNIGTTLSNTYWKASCNFSLIQASGPADVLMALTAGNQDYLTTDSTAGYIETNQDAIGVIIMSTSPYDPTMSNWYFMIEAKKGNVRTSDISTAIYLNPNINNYYIKLERVSAAWAQLSVYSDSTFTTHIAGSPTMFPIDSTITGLNTVQHGTSTPGWYYRFINATIDNDLICDDGNVVNVCGTNFTDSILPNGQVNFTNNGNSSYNTWSFGDGTISNTLNPSHTYTSNGVYTVQESVTDSLNNILCVSTQTIAISNAACSAAAPTVSYSLVADSIPHWWDLYVNYGSSVINATWNWGDGYTSAGLYSSHTYDSTGVYSICVTAYNACGDSATYCQNDSIYRLSYNSTSSLMTHVNVLNANTTGIHTVTSKNNQVTIYPNPATTNFTIETNTSQLQTVQIYDVNGNLVLTQIINGKTMIDASNLAAGVYNLSVISNEGVANKKIIIIK